MAQNFSKQLWSSRTQQWPKSKHGDCEGVRGQGERHRQLFSEIDLEAPHSGTEVGNSNGWEVEGKWEESTVKSLIDGPKLPTEMLLVLGDSHDVLLFHILCEPLGSV